MYSRNLAEVCIRYHKRLWSAETEKRGVEKDMLCLKSKWYNVDFFFQKGKELEYVVVEIWKREGNVKIVIFLINHVKGFQ